MGGGEEEDVYILFMVLVLLVSSRGWWVSAPGGGLGMWSLVKQAVVVRFPRWFVSPGQVAECGLG